MKLVILLLLSLVLFSCGTSKVKKPHSIYSVKSMSAAEMRRLKALERYRQMRKKSWGTKGAFRSITPTPYKSKIRMTRPRLPRALNPDQYRIEALQNIQYFCIKHDSTDRFDSNQDCLTFGNLKLVECEERWISYKISSIIRCLKRSLN